MVANIDKSISPSPFQASKYPFTADGPPIKSLPTSVSDDTFALKIQGAPKKLCFLLLYNYTFVNKSMYA